MGAGLSSCVYSFFFTAILGRKPVVFPVFLIAKGKMISLYTFEPLPGTFTVFTSSHLVYDH